MKSTTKENKDMMIALFKGAIKDSQIKLSDFIPWNKLDLLHLQTNRKNTTLAYIKTISYFKKSYSSGKNEEGNHIFINPDKYHLPHRDLFDGDTELIEISLEEGDKGKIRIVKKQEVDIKEGDKIILKKKGLFSKWKEPIEALEINVTPGKVIAWIAFKGEEKLEAGLTLEEYESLRIMYLTEIENKKIPQKSNTELIQWYNRYHSETEPNNEA